MGGARGRDVSGECAGFPQFQGHVGDAGVDGGCAVGVGAACDGASDDGHCVETLFPAGSGSVPIGAERGDAAVDDGRPGGAGGTGNPGTGPAGEAVV